MLANLIYVCLDTFANVSQNITSKTDAWLTFLSSDKPEDILRLVNQYPEFAECQHDITEFRKKPELISMFSEALIQMDKNTLATGGNRNKSVHLQSIRTVDEMDIQGDVVLLMDNVTTTGNSLYACKEILLSKGAKKVEMFALGRAI